MPEVTDHGYLTIETVRSLAQADDTRLRPVLLRFGAARLTCAAQYVDQIIAAIEGGGDYLRDMSIPV